MRILLVEDDAMIGAAVREGLQDDGYAVDWLQDGAAAELALAGADYALLLLDLGLPGQPGMEILRALRRRRARRCAPRPRRAR
jgi:two-component system response regulator QseB